MKAKILITGTIVAAFVLCIMAVVAVSLQPQPPSAASDSAGDAGKAAQSPAIREATQLSPQDVQLPEIFGMVWDQRGNGLSGITVTLHQMSNVTVDGRVTGVREVSQLTVMSDSYGEYRFSSVPLTPGVDYYYATAKSDLPDGCISCGTTVEMALKADSSMRANIILHIP